MGKKRFMLSDMMPNAWFYKLKYMGRTRNHDTFQHPLKKKHPKEATTQPSQLHLSNPSHSYHFTSEPFKPYIKTSGTHFHEHPRKSSNTRTNRKNIRFSPKFVTSSVSARCRCRTTLDSVQAKSDATPNSVHYDSGLPKSLLPKLGSEDPYFNRLSLWSSSCSCRVSSTATDIIIEFDGTNSFTSKLEKLDKFDPISELELPPILTKPTKFSDMISDIRRKEIEKAKFRSSAKMEEKKDQGSLSFKIVKKAKMKTLKEHKTTSPPIRRSLSGSSGLKLRLKSPRISSRKIQFYNWKTGSSTTSSRSQRKNITNSFAVVKSSFNPQKDFRDSMLEMILENNIWESKDLEALLASYLSLNSNEYHDLIVKVFQKIWLDLIDNRL